jgi:hypothetical protein
MLDFRVVCHVSADVPEETAMLALPSSHSLTPTLSACDERRSAPVGLQNRRHASPPTQLRAHIMCVNTQRKRNAGS